MTHSRSEVQRLLQAHGLNPSRALGQNFVADPNTVRRIARLAELATGDRVIEVGAGLGSLTLALVETGAAVTALEMDRHLIPVLSEQVSAKGVRVVHGDAMTIEFGELVGHNPAEDDRDDRWALVANLPYNVAVPVITRFLDGAGFVHAMLVMVQREVGERLAASPGTRSYGFPSVRIAYYSTAKIVGRVPPSVFVPRPRVESVLVRIVRRDQVAVDPSTVPAQEIFSLARAGFAHRRKMLRRSLEGLVDSAAFDVAAIDPELRAEDLSVEDWGKLAGACRRSA